MAVVRLSGIRFSYGTTPVLTGVDLEVAAGECVGLAGPNGAGKTTLLSIISTLTRPSAGAGEVLSAELGTDRVRYVRPSIGWSGHEPALYDELTLSENLAHFARLAGRDRSEADRVLDQVGLAAAASRRADRSSNGMRRRADLARLLMLEPRLVLFDEVHAGLDAGAGVIVDAIAERALTSGGAVVMVSHDADHLKRRTDRVLELTDGRLT
jgi:ABC-type multidrug transport system ATPase subunit